MIAISSSNSSSQLASIPRYGKMPMGASPAKAFGARVSAGPKADLNSSQREDHSTSRRGGSGHGSFGRRSRTAGMVATSDIVSDGVSDYVSDYVSNYVSTTLFLGGFPLV